MKKNRKRHTVAKRWLTGSLMVTLVSLIAVACAPRATIVPEATYVPQVVAPTPTSAKAAFTDARAKSDAANIHAAKASDAVDRSKRGVDVVGVGMRDLMYEVARLKSQKNASESELGEVYRQMVELEKSRSILLEDISVAQSELECERELRKEAYARLTLAEGHAHAMEAYAEKTKGQLLHAQAVSGALKVAVDKASVVVAEKAAEASELRGSNSLKNKLLIGASVLAFVEFLVILLLIRTKLPIP